MELGRVRPISDANEDLRLYAMLGEIDIVRHMITVGAYVDDADTVEGNTPMMEAARCGNTEIVRELLRHRADVSLANGMGQTPMWLAVRNGHAETVRTLVRHGTPCKDGRGWSALVEAARLGHAEVARVVIMEGRRDGQVPGPGMDINTTNLIGETGLMLAAANGDVYTVRTLLELSADVDAQDMHGTTALMKASGSGHADVTSMLLEVGANVGTSDDAGHTAVLYASRHGHLEVVRTLIDFGAAAHTLGGKRMFEQPSWGPNALNTMETVPMPGRYLPEAGPSPFLAPSRLQGPQLSGGPNPPMGVPGGMSFGLHESLGLHALDMRGVATLHTRGTALSSQLSLPDIAGATAMVPAAKTDKQQIHGLRDNTHKSAGDSEYQIAKKRLLEDVFGPPPTVVEREKPFKAADGASFETRQELEAYEEDNLPFVCGACKSRFGGEIELKAHFRKQHKPAGFLMEEAKAGRDRGTVDQAWQDLDIAELYTEQHELRTSIERALGDSSVDADELDSIIRQLRKCDVPRIALDRLLVALGDGETSEGDKALLLKYCPEDVPKQKTDIFNALIMYSAHLNVLYEDYAKNPGKDPAFTKERFEMLLKAVGVVGSDFKKNRSDQVFERVVRQRAGRNMDGTIKQAETITPAEFIHALIRLAYIKFGNLIGVHDKFIWLMKRHILTHEKIIEVDDKLALDMDTPKMKTLNADKKRKGSLKKTFARYGEKRDGQQVMTLSQFMGMLKSANILPQDEFLTERECRYCFLAVNDDETSTLEPMGGMTADSAIIVSYAGFCECLARLARAKFIIPKYDPEDTSKPGKLKPLAPAYKEFVDDLIQRTHGLDFLALKRVGLTMKRKTAQQIKEKEAAERGEEVIKGIAPGLLAVKEKLGQDVADMLETESKARLAMFSVLANYGCDEPTRNMLLRYLADAGVDPERLLMVEECLKEIEGGGKLREKAKRVLVANNIATAPEEELEIIVKELEAGVPLMQPVFVYYGASDIYCRSDKLGALDAEGLQLMLTELAVLSDGDAEAPRDYCTRVLNNLKKSRPPHKPGDLPPSDHWEWPLREPPAHLTGQARKKFVPEPGDMLTFSEFKLLAVRVAYDKYKSTPGGLGVRVKALMADTVARHWVHTVDKGHETLKKDFKGKLLKAVVSKHRTNLRKIYKEIADWTPQAMDPANTFLFLEACDLQPSFDERQRRLRYLVFTVCWHHEDKELFDVWCKCLAFVCKEGRALGEAMMSGGEISTWPLLEAEEPEPEPEPEDGAAGAEEKAVKPPELKGAPSLVVEKVTPFATSFNNWLEAGILALPWNWKDQLKKVRGKKEKERKKALAAEEKAAAKRAAAEAEAQPPS
jgi:ankyrin repeat protein